MDVEKWLDILGRFGGQTVLVLALVWFFYKDVWPAILERMKEAETARQRELDKFEAALRQTNEAHINAVKEIVSAIHELRTEVLRTK